jgi:hypothetical protein
MGESSKKLGAIRVEGFKHQSGAQIRLFVISYASAGFVSSYNRRLTEVILVLHMIGLHQLLQGFHLLFPSPTSLDGGPRPHHIPSRKSTRVKQDANPCKLVPYRKYSIYPPRGRWLVVSPVLSHLIISRPMIDWSLLILFKKVHLRAFSRFRLALGVRWRI